MSQYVSRTLADRRKPEPLGLRYVFGIAGIALMIFCAGFLLGQQDRPFATELSAARTIAGFNAELIGFQCGDHQAVVLGTWEDEFPPCKEIRRLDDEVAIL